MFFKTFAQKQIEQKGRNYDRDVRRASMRLTSDKDRDDLRKENEMLKAEIAKLKAIRA